MIMSSTVQRPRALYHVVAQLHGVWFTLDTLTNLDVAKRRLKNSPYAGRKVIRVELQEIQ